MFGYWFYAVGYDVDRVCEIIYFDFVEMIALENAIGKADYILVDGSVLSHNFRTKEDEEKIIPILENNQNEDGTYSWKFDNYARVFPPYDMPTGAIQSLWSSIECPSIQILTFSCLTSASDLPTAAINLPQLGSLPVIIVLTSGEETTVRAADFASDS